MISPRRWDPLQELEEGQEEKQPDDAHPTPDVAVVHVAEGKAGEIEYTDGDENRSAQS